MSIYASATVSVASKYGIKLGGLLPRIAFLSMFVSACGAKMESSPNVDGDYTIELTCVNTYPVARTASAPGLLDATGRRYPYSLTLSSKGLSSGKIRVTSGTGCSYVASVNSSGNVAATNIDCDPLAVDSALWERGFESRKVLSFDFAPKEGSLKEFSSVNLRVPDYFHPDIPLKSYTICEGHTPSRPDQNGTFRLQYDGNAKYSVKQPDAIEQAAAPGCTDLVGDSWTSGSLYVHYGQTKNDLIVYEEGVGCTTHAKSIDGTLYSADGTDCEFGDFGVNMLGVKSRHFNTYSIDLGAKTWSYSRTDDTSALSIPQCLQATSQLTGNLPQ